MPNRDGTGPVGKSRKGKGLGPCGRTENAKNNSNNKGSGQVPPKDNATPTAKQSSTKKETS